MINVEQACEIAIRETQEPFITAITDVGRGYVIGTTAIIGEVPTGSPLLIDKETGKTEVYFIPHHFEELKKGIKVKVPSKYRKAAKG